MLRLRKKPLISENDHFEHPHLCHHPYPLPFPPPWKTLDISPPEILPQPLANLILPSGPFFTLIWGWNNSQVIIAAAFKNYLAASAILLITDPPFLPNFTPVYFLLFLKAKELLAGLSLTQESPKKTWVGVSKTVTTKTFAAAIPRWYERREKCMHIGGDHVEKS